MCGTTVNCVIAALRPQAKVIDVIGEVSWLLCHCDPVWMSVSVSELINCLWLALVWVLHLNLARPIVTLVLPVLSICIEMYCSSACRSVNILWISRICAVHEFYRTIMHQVSANSCWTSDRTFTKSTCINTCNELVIEWFWRHATTNHVILSCQPFWICDNVGSSE